MPTHQLLRTGVALLLALSVGSLTAQAQRTRTTPPPTKVFEEKSGVVEMKMSMMGIEPTLTLYFDDFGNKTATVVRMEMMEQTVTQHSVKIGNVTTEWNDQTMEGTRTVGGDGSALTLAAYTNLSPVQKRVLNYRELESRQVAGRTASGFAIDTAGSTIQVWHWRNIPLYIYIETQGAEGNATFEATSVNVPSAVAPEAFIVPKGVKISNGRGR